MSKDLTEAAKQLMTEEVKEYLTYEVVPVLRRI